MTRPPRSVSVTSIPCIRYQSSPIGSSSAVVRRPFVYTGGCSSTIAMSGHLAGQPRRLERLLRAPSLVVADQAGTHHPELGHGAQFRTAAASRSSASSWAAASGVIPRDSAALRIERIVPSIPSASFTARAPS